MDIRRVAKTHVPYSFEYIFVGDPKGQTDIGGKNVIHFKRYAHKTG